MKLVLLTIGLLALAFVGIALKVWIKKGGKFAGTCASQNPHLNLESKSCGFCRKPSDTKSCAKNTHPHPSNTES